MKKNILILVLIALPCFAQVDSLVKSKPVIAEYKFNALKVYAIQFLGKENYSRCHEFVSYNLTNVASDFDRWFEIRTNGVDGQIFHRVYKGQWVVKWVYGYRDDCTTCEKYVFLVFDPHYFEKLFDPVD